MSKLTEFKNSRDHYYYDDQHRKQGVCKHWWWNGILFKHYLVKDDVYHGEHRRYTWIRGIPKIDNLSFYQAGDNITDQVRELVEDINNITPKEKLIIKIKFGIECLS